MNKPYSDIAARLVLIRKAVSAAGQSQTAYAAAAGIPINTYNNWESGDHRISLNGALKLRTAYGVPLDFIYCGGQVDALPEKIRKAVIESPRESHSA